MRVQGGSTRERSEREVRTPWLVGNPPSGGVTRRSMRVQGGSTRERSEREVRTPWLVGNPPSGGVTRRSMRVQEEHEGPGR